jgi:hypothetical protein
MASVKGWPSRDSNNKDWVEMTAGMEVPMFGSIGISEWVAASIMLWLAAQLPLGMLVGFYLRRATVLSTLGTVEAVPAYAQRNRGWQDLLQGRVVSAAQRAL